MRILFLSDEECKTYWDFFKKEDFADIDIIVSCGDLKAEYLDFLATLSGVPVLYVRGNHDRYDKVSPEGCICIEDTIYEYEGVRFLGLGGCHRYNNEGRINQYSQKEMNRRVQHLFWKLRKSKGFDVLVTHAPAAGLNDAPDPCHQGFTVFRELLTKYKPSVFAHGHVHLNYGRQFPREDHFESTRIYNAYNHVIVDI